MEQQKLENKSLKSAFVVLQNVVEEIKSVNANVVNLKDVNKLLSSTKRLRMANILYKEECRQQKVFLKKYIKKSKSSPLIRKSATDVNETILEKARSNHSLIPDDECFFQNNKPKKSIEKEKEKEKEVQRKMELEEPRAPQPAQQNDILLIEKLQDDDIREMIKEQMDLSKLKSDFFDKIRNDEKESAFQNLCYQIHTFSKNACNQVQGLYNKIRINVQNILQEQNVVSFNLSSQWFKNTVDLFQIEQKRFTQSLALLKEKRNNFSLDLVKYDNQYLKQKTYIEQIEKRNNNEFVLYSHELDKSKITVSKFPNKQREAKVGDLPIGVSDITHFEIFPNPQDPETIRSILILSGRRKLSLSHFYINNYQFCKKQTFYEKVYRMQHQKVQDCFAVLYEDCRVIDVFDELGQRIYRHNQPDKHKILSFCFHIDHEYLHIIMFLSNLNVEYLKIRFNEEGKLNFNQRVQPIKISTDIYLESTKIPSETDDPDLHFISNNKFYLQFQNKLYICYSNDIEIGVLLYDSSSLIETTFQDNIIFRVYKHDITIQYYDQSGLYSETSIFSIPLQGLSLKQVSIIRINEKEHSYQIDAISFSNLFYTFYYTITE